MHAWPELFICAKDVSGGRGTDVCVCLCHSGPHSGVASLKIRVVGEQSAARIGCSCVLHCKCKYKYLVWAYKQRLGIQQTPSGGYISSCTEYAKTCVFVSLLSLFRSMQLQPLSHPQGRARGNLDRLFVAPSSYHRPSRESRQTTPKDDGLCWVPLLSSRLAC